LRPTCGCPEARDHLVEDHQDAVLPAAISQAGKKSVDRRNHADVASDRLDDEGRDRGTLSGEQRVNGGEIVVARE
jgi:hypothetical protein